MTHPVGSKIARKNTRKLAVPGCERGCESIEKGVLMYREERGVNVSKGGVNLTGAN